MRASGEARVVDVASKMYAQGGIRALYGGFGATLVGVECARPGREDDDDGREDITLGYDDCESYDQTEGRPYFGAVCGRPADGDRSYSAPS